METHDEIVRGRMALSLEGETSGSLEILAITAGEGNGWQFSAGVLQESLALWNGAPCFVDHQRSASGRSVRDLAGLCSEARWDDTRQGIRLRLHPYGPAASLAQQLGQHMPILALEAGEQARSPVGFSADLSFTAHGRQVQRILHVLSVDLVLYPARGGVFLARDPQADASNLGDQTLPGSEKTCKGDLTMQDTQPQTKTVDQTALESAQLSQPAGDAGGWSQLLLDTAIQAARLPEAFGELVRRQFDGRTPSAAEVQRALSDARHAWSQVSGPAAVSGPSEPRGRISGMFSSEDQLQAAVDDLLGAPRNHGLEGVRPARLSGIKELYMLLTGDRDLYGGYYAERVSLATTANFTGLVKNALNKVVAQQWDAYGAAGYNWWQRVTSQEHFDSLNDITGILVGTVGALPEIAEGGEYTELKVGDSPESASFKKFGGYIPLTLELIDRDETRKLRHYPRELAKAGIRRISALVAEVFTANSGIGPTLADGGALFNATAVTAANGHANLRTTALSTSEWEAVKTAVYRQPILVSNEVGLYGSGPAQALNPRYLLVPKALELTGKKILYGEYDATASVIGNNLQRQMLGDVVVVPEWTDANDWAAAVDPALAPGIIVGERFGLMPEVFIAGDEQSPAVFMNDEHRLKVRHFVAVLVQDWRALHKNNVA